MEKTLAIPGAGRAVRFIGTRKPHRALTRRVFGSRVILTVTPDDAMAAVARKFARMVGKERRGRVVLHTGGALDVKGACAAEKVRSECCEHAPIADFQRSRCAAELKKVSAATNPKVKVRGGYG